MDGKKRAVLISAAGMLVAAGYVIAIHVATEPWRVFDNDHRPFLWAVPALVGTVGVAIVALWRPRILVLLVLLVPLFLASRQRIIRQRLQDSVASCANHSAFWGPYDFEGTESLTNSTEFADFLTEMHAGQKTESDLLPGRCCPGYRRVGSRTGVVFVGGGMRLASLRGEEVLVAFCSWKSHPIPYDHQHCLVWEWGMGNESDRGMFRRECSDTRDMIGRIERALKQADEGVVPYSRAACELLTDELQKRKGIRNKSGSHRPNGSAIGSQPFRSETNRTSSAAVSRR